MTSPLPEITTKISTEISNQSINQSSIVKKINNAKYDRWMEKT